MMNFKIVVFLGIVLSVCSAQLTCYDCVPKSEGNCVSPDQNNMKAIVCEDYFKTAAVNETGMRRQISDMMAKIDSEKYMCYTLFFNAGIEGFTGIYRGCGKMNLDGNALQFCDELSEENKNNLQFCRVCETDNCNVKNDVGVTKEIRVLVSDPVTEKEDEETRRPMVVVATVSGADAGKNDTDEGTGGGATGYIGVLSVIVMNTVICILIS